MGMDARVLASLSPAGTVLKLQMGFQLVEDVEMQSGKLLTQRLVTTETS
jgi:hypothetical protein